MTHMCNFFFNYQKGPWHACSTHLFVQLLQLSASTAQQHQQQHHQKQQQQQQKHQQQQQKQQQQNHNQQQQAEQQNQQKQQHNNHNKQQGAKENNEQSNILNRKKSAAENFCENLVLGDILLNHIAEPEGWIISNEAGATLSKTDHLIQKASERLGTPLKPDCLLEQLGTNDLAYNKPSATEIITKYTDVIVNVKNRFTESKIGVCSISPCKGKGDPDDI